jgi:hypothetical protein
MTLWRIWPVDTICKLQSSLGMFVYRRLVADQIHRQTLAS